MPCERVARFNRAKNIEETKPLDSEILDSRVNVSEKKKKVEFSSLVHYNILPPIPVERDETLVISKDSSNNTSSNSLMSKWFNLKSFTKSKWFKKYLTVFGKVTLIFYNFSQNYIYLKCMQIILNQNQHQKLYY